MEFESRVNGTAYSVRDCAKAAFAGALANTVALSVLSKGASAGHFIFFVLFFGIGFSLLAVVGRRMARKLADESRDTLLNGLVLGAAIGSLAGTLLAAIFISTLFTSPVAAFSFSTPLFGLLFGVVNGGVAGGTFVWLGRRRSFCSLPGEAERSNKERGWRQIWWFWPLVLCGLGLPAASIVAFSIVEKPKPKSFAISGTIYNWPKGTTVSLPEPGHYGKGYVIHRSSDRYPDPDAFFIIYDGNAQEPFNEAGLPHLQMITSRFDKASDFAFQTTPAGQVVCNRRSAQVGLAYPCGLSFVHRGARWQLHFGAHRAKDAEKLHSQAIARLETLRRPVQE